MKLLPKLFLGVGILLLAMVAALYFLPIFFIRKDVDKAALTMQNLLIEDQQELARTQQVWVRNELNSTEQNIESILAILYEDDTLSSKIVMSGENSLENVWYAMGQIAGYDPEIGFIQVHSPEKNQAAVVYSFAGQFYSSSKNVDTITLRSLDREKKKETFYKGLILPEKMQTEEGYILYALLDPSHFLEELTEIERRISKVDPALIEERSKSSQELVFADNQEEKSAFFWAIKIDMLRSLLPLLTTGVVVEKESKMLTPEGIARLDAKGYGLSILTKEITETTPLFNDAQYYETHPPKTKTPPIAGGVIFINKGDENEIFIANTIRIKNTFVTIGMPLSHTIRQLALASNSPVLLKVQNRFWIGTNNKGEKISIEEINRALEDQNKSRLKPMISLKEGDLVFYSLQSLGEEEPFIKTLLNLEEELTSKISLQISLISIAALILVFLFIGRMGYTMIYPITKLADATADITAGKYDEVVLPEVGSRKDEVAVLTRSFKDMVVGLQEREKIRGVLDKVVSKDVAKEILRTQIHLGGEDRVVTMLFGDIRDFTHLTENISPQETIQMLNKCMTIISRVIEGEGGVIDKYVGDEVMAIFGAPTVIEEHALRAVSSGMLIVKTLRQWNNERAKRGELVLEMGMGVHTGLVVVGNMGAEDRLNYTVLGANVNLASRLCSVAKPNQLIISELTLKQPEVEESFFVQPLEPINLKGFKEPVKIYEVTGFKWDET